jgi:hypothetical protein
MHDIKTVAPETGPIDSIVWTAEVRFDYGPEAQVLSLQGWKGVVALYHEPVRTGSLPGPGPGKLTLAATWESEHEHSQMFSNSTATMRFRTALPGDALDRIEQFRAGGRLFARLEGKLRFFALGPIDADARTRIEALLACYDVGRKSIWNDLWGDSLELTRDLWTGTVLPVLRPPGRVVLEAALPKVESDQEAARRAFAYIAKAQASFDEGRYEPVGAAIYKALEALQTLFAHTDAAYGPTIRGFVKTEVGALSALANEVRHDEAKMKRPTSDIDRTLALHLLTATKSVAAVILATRS